MTARETRRDYDTDEIAEIRDRLARFERWADTSPDVSRSRSGWQSWKPEDVPADCRVTNAERGKLGAWDFQHSRPERYFVYVRMIPPTGRIAGDGFDRGGIVGGRQIAEFTTFTGEVLGRGSLGAPYRDNFGGRRRSVSFRGINGADYFGTFYESAGDYARVKLSRKGR